jgi:hypothetical protein
VKNEGWEKNCGGGTFHVLASPPYATPNNTKESTMHNHDHHDELIKQKKLNIKTRRGKGVQHGVYMEQKRKVKKSYEA